MSDKWHGGKGDKSRPTNQEKYKENWDRIFNKKQLNEPKK